MDRGTEGDDFHDACRELYPRLLTAFRALGCELHDAEDVAQEALARLHDRWIRNRPDRPMAWCYTVGRNLAITRSRRRAVEERLSRDLRREATMPAVDVATSEVVRGAVRRLPRRQREAIIQRYFLGSTIEQTAADMKCAPGTVTALTHQGLARLREQLIDDWVEHDPEVKAP